MEVASGVEEEEEVTRGHATVYTPVLPALEHDDHLLHRDDARLVYEAAAVGVAAHAAVMHDERLVAWALLVSQKAVGAGHSAERSEDRVEPKAEEKQSCWGGGVNVMLVLWEGGRGEDTNGGGGTSGRVDG